jgi:uncharacterized membrane protein YkgB
MKFKDIDKVKRRAPFIFMSIMILALLFWIMLVKFSSSKPEAMVPFTPESPVMTPQKP